MTYEVKLRGLKPLTIGCQYRTYTVMANGPCEATWKAMRRASDEGLQALDVLTLEAVRSVEEVLSNV